MIKTAQPKPPVVTLIGAATSYINRRADGFSGTPGHSAGMPDELSGIPELSGNQAGWGGGRAFIRPLLPTAIRNRLPGYGPPELSAEYKQMVQRSQALAEIANDLRAQEDKVFINGMMVPGIFKGFKLSGGIFTEKATAQARDKKIKGQTVTKNFSIDLGDRPIAGAAEFMFLDDRWSEARDKYAEFTRIITAWDRSQIYSQEKIERVFIIQSYFNGPGFSGPFNFSRIKIIGYHIDAPTDTLEGVIEAGFEFEQYDTPESEGQTVPPLTPAQATGGQQTENTAEADLPPGGAEFTTG